MEETKDMKLMTIRKKFIGKRLTPAEPKPPKQPKPLKKRKRARKIPVRKKRPPHEFKVPLNVYQNALDEIKTRKPVEFINKKHFDSHVPVNNQNQCFNNGEKSVRVSGKFGLLQKSNFQRAAKQALENRDFKALYKLVIKGFELNNKDLNRVLYDYLYIAIEHDPKIEAENRESMLLEAIKRCKVTFSDGQNDKEALKHIKNSHFLQKRNGDSSDDDESS